MKINNSRKNIHLGAEMEREILLITMEGKLHAIHTAKGDTAPKKPPETKQNKQTSHSLMNGRMDSRFFSLHWLERRQISDIALLTVARVYILCVVADPVLHICNM